MPKPILRLPKSRCLSLSVWISFVFCAGVCQGWFLCCRARPPYLMLQRTRGNVHCLQGGGGPGGVGRVAGKYSWTENEWEVEVTVPVPARTRKEDVLFKAAATSVKLGLVNSTELLLGGKLMGRIALDGTYWSLEGEGNARAVKLLLEKKLGALENNMDWRRVLSEEAATEVEYQEAEKFDTQAYIHQMLGPGGVNMSLVDREMFGGLAGGVMANVSQEALREYVEGKVLDDATGMASQGGRSGGGGEQHEEPKRSNGS